MLKPWSRRYRTGISCSCVSLFFVIVCCSPVHGQDAAYLAELSACARDQHLHADSYWHILLHYQKGLGGYESLIDDPAFFLAPDGKTNPEAELQATLRAFFDTSTDEKQSAVCRFTARYEWLRQRLNIDPKRLPLAECPPFERFMEQVKPESVALIFPMAHLNAPASMFGHTLLTIETANKSKLLAYAVTYSAFTNETFGPQFAVKGLTGLYPGYFSIMPYYAKLQEYSDIDHRDIWEYPLNLTKPEIRRMMLHIRELEHIASDYYFFDENCSYALFFLLEAARPSVHLTAPTKGWLIPLDSIRMIEEQGLITGVTYRPSRTTKISYLAAGLSEPAQARALAMAKGTLTGASLEDPNIPDQEKIKTYELAGEYLLYLYTKGEVAQTLYQERFLKILRLRSQLGVDKESSADRIPMPVPPDKGHRSNRLALGVGLDRDEAFLEIRIRPVYHGLMDCDDGYVKGAQLIFTDLVLRCFPSENKVALEGLDVIDIMSLSPRNKFFHPISWKIKTGITRITGDDEQDHLVYQINPGGGLAFDAGPLDLVYAMLETGLNVGGALQHDYALGAGGSFGLVTTLNTHWKAHLFARDIAYGPGDRFNAFEACLQQSFIINPAQSIALDLSRRKTRGVYQTEARLAWNFFF